MPDDLLFGDKTQLQLNVLQLTLCTNRHKLLASAAPMLNHLYSVRGCSRQHKADVCSE